MHFLSKWLVYFFQLEYWRKLTEWCYMYAIFKIRKTSSTTITLSIHSKFNKDESLQSFNLYS